MNNEKTIKNHGKKNTHANHTAINSVYIDCLCTYAHLRHATTGVFESTNESMHAEKRDRIGFISKRFDKTWEAELVQPHGHIQQ